MDFKLNPLSQKRRIKAFPVICLLILGLTHFSAKAQYNYGGGDDSHTYGVALKVGYDVPVGNLGYTFKAAPAYSFSVLSNRNNFTASVTIGYHFYKPKQDTFYYAVDATNYGTVTYKNFTVLSLYLGAAYNLEISEGFKVYGGFDFGVYETHMVSQSADEYIGGTDDEHQENAYVAGKLGLNYLLDEHFGIGVEGKYNLFAPTGQKADNPAVGSFYNSYSGSLVLTYNF